MPLVVNTVNRIKQTNIISQIANNIKQSSINERLPVEAISTFV